MKTRAFWFVLQTIIRIAGIGLGSFRVFAFLFFGSDTPTVLVVPGLVLLTFAFTPLRFLSWDRSFIKWLLGLYVFSYFLGGIQRIIEYRQIMPDILEFSIVLCFLGLIWKQKSVQK